MHQDGHVIMLKNKLLKGLNHFEQKQSRSYVTTPI